MTKRRAVLLLVIPILIYVPLVAKESFRTRHDMQPDAVAYLRTTQYLAEGEFAKSVSGYWSPLFSWCAAPLNYLGMDGLYSTRLVLAAWGAVLVAASYCVSRSLAPTRVSNMQLGALSLVAVLTVPTVTQFLAPDVIMFALLMAYFAAASSMRFLQRKGLSFLAGALGGLAYLAKSYALPFFVVHFTFTVALHFLFNRKITIGRAVIGWAIGLGACLMISGPWIGILSWKYGEPTFSTVARAAHTIVGPTDKPRFHPAFLEGLHRIDEGRISIWETPYSLPYNEWSPLESKQYFRHQCKYACLMIRRLVETIARYDAFSVTIPALVFLPVIAWQLKWRAVLFRTLWVLGTVLIYCLPLTLVYFSERYVRGVFWPLCCIYCLCLGGYSIQRISGKLRLGPRSVRYLNGLLFLSFTTTCAYHARHLVLVREPPMAALRSFAHDIEKAGCTGPIAALGGHGVGMYVAYHADEPFLGCPINASVVDVEDELERFGVRTLLVYGDDALSHEFRQHTSWERRLAAPFNGGRLIAYVPPRHSKRGRTSSSGLGMEGHEGIEPRTDTDEKEAGDCRL